MTRRTMAERKRRASERDARRESLLVLLSRTRRGVPLTPSEAALMFAHVEVELAEADELRRTVAGQQNAIQAAHGRTAAAEAAIVEAEAEAERFKADCLSACGTIADMHAAAVGEVRGPIRGVVEDVADVRAELIGYRAAEVYRKTKADTFAGRLDAMKQKTSEGIVAAFEQLEQRAEQAEGHLATYVNVFGPDAVDDFHAVQHRAVTAEAALASVHRDAVRLQAAWRSARRRAQEHYTEQQRVRGWTAHWADRYRNAEHRAGRYRTAWFAARRDRKADRAAMAAELPLVQAGQQALALAAERCEPQNVDKDHPVIDLLNALKSSRPHPAPSALVRRYYDAIHTEACPRSHRA
ncbi:hypothetical protein [Streptomyces sp. NPDC006333]|uniref:hypothetical protein n=1 Tax=Streptomyces sp. NPDC006333 TaxID=3156753 RepID=UPI0033BF5928